jgi:hypothetical protein
VREKMMAYLRKKNCAYGKKFRSRSSFTLVECLLTVLIFGAFIGAVISSALFASRLETFSRAELGARTTASSLFEVLESVSPSSLGADFNGAVSDSIALLGGSGNRLRGFTVGAETASEPGVRVVRLTLSSSSQRAPLVVERAINGYSEETVDDIVE